MLGPARNSSCDVGYRDPSALAPCCNLKRLPQFAVLVARKRGRGHADSKPVGGTSTERGEGAPLLAGRESGHVVLSATVMIM